MAIEIVDGPTIEAGQSLSDAVDCSRGEIVRLTMPADWFDSVISFQISSDGVFFNDVYDHKGDEITVEVIPGAAIIVPPGYLAAAAFIKFRSGTHDHPQAQPANRAFAIALKVPDAAAPASPAINIRLVS
jgi:hypothetical protein